VALELKVNLEVSRYIARLKKFGQEFSAREMLKTIGEETRSWIEEVFDTEGASRTTGNKWKPLSPNTIAAKTDFGHARPTQILFATGALKKSFDIAIDDPNSVTVGTSNPYARFHQDGTKGPYFIFPRKAGGLLSFVTVGGRVFRTHVIHPGLPKRRFMPTKGEQLQIARYSAAWHIEKALGETDKPALDLRRNKA
jgi:phage gpG-like protein